MTHPGFTQTIATVLEDLATDSVRGLTSAEAAARLVRDGPNQLAETTPPAWWRELLAQFHQFVIWILIAATIVSAVLGDWLEAGAIFAIIFLNALLGFFQERKAEEALSSLRKLSSPNARVLRDGSLHNLATRELVRGDVVELEAGDRVPADLRLLSAFGLRMQEATLTGESTPVGKEAGMFSHTAAAHALSATMTSTLYVLAAIGILFSRQLGSWSFGGLGIGTAAILTAYLLGIRLVFYDQRAAFVATEEKQESPPRNGKALQRAALFVIAKNVNYFF